MLAYNLFQMPNLYLEKICDSKISFLLLKTKLNKKKCVIQIEWYFFPDTKVGGVPEEEYTIPLSN